MAPNSSFVVVSDIRVRGTLTEPRYFVRISLGNQGLETTKAKPHDSELEWATPLTLTVADPGSLELVLELFSIAKDTVFRFSKKFRPVSAGKSHTIWDVSNSQASREVALGNAVISFNLQVSTMEKVVENDLDDASQATQAIRQLSVSEDLDLGGKLLRNLQPALDAAQPFLEKFEAVVTLMDKVTKVHPYLNAAWVVLSAIPKIYIQELAQNKQFMDLLDSLKETYKCILKDQNLQQLDSQNIQELIGLLANHTRECAYFIQAHASRSHRARLFDTVFASPEKRIEDLQKRLEELQKKLTNLLTQAAAVGAVQNKRGVATAIEGIAFVGEELEDLSQKIDLNDIPYAGGVKYSKKKCCLPKTRTSLLQEIRDWVDCFEEDETEKVFVLTGLAGSGKSSIAHSICDHYHQLQRLGSSFFFVRSTDTPGGDKVFSTIARDIADQFPLFKVSLARIVGQNRSLRQTKEPSEQFQSFIVEPSQALTESEVLSVGPVLLVIDALDECPEESREELVQTLVEDLPNLPPNFRLLITSRPDEVEDLLKAPFVRHVDLSVVGPAEAEADIRLFIIQRTTKVAHKLNDPQEKPHQDDWLDQLVKQSEKLFIWADTACKQITSPKTRAPAEVLNAILKSGGSGIDDLYKLAVERAIGDDLQSLADFKAVMSRLIILKWPMSVNELNFMQSFVDGNDDFPPDVSFLVSHLGALLGGALNANEHLQFLHTSFRDFLLDEKRSGPFCINDNDSFAAAHLSLANTCAAILRFLKTTVDSRTDKSNCRPIGYAFLFADHLEESGGKLDLDIMGSIDTVAMVLWRERNFMPYPSTTTESNAALTGWTSLVKLKYDPSEYMTKLGASPPTGYSWTISSNDQNPHKLRSRSFHITVSNPTWSTSICALSPAGCLDWAKTWIAFVSPRNTILIWYPSCSKYIWQPVQLGNDEVVQMTLDPNGSYLAALTSEHLLVLFRIELGAKQICRVVLDPPQGLPTCFLPFPLTLIILFNFGNDKESLAFDTVSSTMYPNIDGVPHLTPSEKDGICDTWEMVCKHDVL